MVKRQASILCIDRGFYIVFLFDDDFLTHEEYKYCEQIIGRMSDVSWVQPLLKKINDFNYPNIQRN